MTRTATQLALAGLTFVALLLVTDLSPARGKLPPPKPAPENPPTTGKVTPKLEPIAETKLIMEGIAHTNYRGLEKLLAKRPADVQTWTFARGQALLLAESGNLLMIRPPKNQGQPVWFERSMELRGQATQLAYELGRRDYERSQAVFRQLTLTCNRCHQQFRVPVEIGPVMPEPPAPKVE